ncbi:MAG: hypothetical protein DI630_00935 [Gordonia sp. (in: high G+C Gram-positive bacteria)]|nr:MAG: hypothetical protein DI630_00935 [Gordonia sp. (in: high G+C Gram-positive bacteria)]
METRVRDYFPLANRVEMYELSAPVTDRDGTEHHFVAAIDSDYGSMLFATNINGEVLRASNDGPLDVLPELIGLRASKINLTAREGLEQLLCFTVTR